MGREKLGKILIKYAVILSIYLYLKGCDHMTCRCKYEFCYKCGGKYRECECVQSKFI